VADLCQQMDDNHYNGCPEQDFQMIEDDRATMSSTDF